MTRNNMRVKVKVADLIAAMEEKRATMVAAHARDLASYEKREDDYRAHVVQVLTAAADKIARGGELPKTGYRRQIEIPCKRDRPAIPKLDTYRIDRDLSALRMAADEAITISAVDYAEYLS